MNRREFVSWCGVGALAGSLPLAIAACSPQTTSSSKAKARADGFTAVGSLQELQQAGKISERAGSEPLLVIASSTAGQPPTAVNPTCTHRGCTVEWQASQQALVCPCHGSEFDRSGKVINGPASKPLATYAVKVEGGQVLVQIPSASS